MLDATAKALIAQDLNAVLRKYGVRSGVFVLITDKEVFQLCGTANDSSGQTEFTKELSNMVAITLQHTLGRSNNKPA